MEPNKLEKQFKTQLDSREIQPSKMAWDKLDEILTNVNEKPKRNFRWIYIAASLLGFLLVGTIYLNRFETIKTNSVMPIVHEQKTDMNNLEEPKIINKDPFNNSIQNKKRIIQTVIAENNNSKKHEKNLNNKEQKVSIDNQSKDNNVIANSSENNIYQSVTKNKYTSAEKLLAEISNAKFETKTTEETIYTNKKAISVNPNDLLINAETELNQSFRESALDRFNKKLNAVKTVLVNRNYEE